MRRTFLIVALALLASAVLVPAAPARADELSDARAYFGACSRAYDGAWEHWSLAYLCVRNRDSVVSPMWYDPAPEETDPAEWVSAGDAYAAAAADLRARFARLWQRMTTPHRKSVRRWRALAQWVEHYSPRSTDTVRDAKRLLRILRSRYGAVPYLRHPLRDLTRLSRRAGL